MLGLVLAAAASVMVEAPTEVDGRCLYPQAFDAYRDSAILALCDRAEIGPRGEVVFLRNDEVQMRFTGYWDGGELVVDRVILRSGRVMDAQGECAVSYKNAKISNVACLANDGPLAFAANLVVTGI